MPKPIIGLIVAAQVAVLAGIGPWFPLSSPALWAANDPALPSVTIAQLTLVPITSLAVALSTVAWWRQTPLHSLAAAKTKRPDPPTTPTGPLKQEPK